MRILFSLIFAKKAPDEWTPARALAVIRGCQISECSWCFKYPDRKMSKDLAFEKAWLMQQYL